MTSHDLYRLTKELAELQRLHFRHELFKDLKAKLELLNSIKDCFKTFDDITSVSVNFCDSVVEKENSNQPYLKMDPRSGESLRNIKENVIQLFVEEHRGNSEINLSSNLEKLLDQKIINLQEQKEKIRINNCVLNNFPLILNNNFKDNELIDLSDISRIDSDCEELESKDSD